MSAARDTHRGSRRFIKAIKDWIPAYIEAERKSKDVTPCVYCGAPSTSIDHVPPQSARPILVSQGLQKRYPFLTVPACHECNGLLSNLAYWTVKERKAYIKKTLRKRYDAVLRIPDWSDSELKELGRTLQSYVLHGLVLRDWVTRRLQW